MVPPTLIRLKPICKRIPKNANPPIIKNTKNSIKYLSFDYKT